VTAYFCVPPTSLARLVPWHYTLLRVFTYPLGHHDFPHLLANVIALVDNGPACEGQSEGKGAFGVFYAVWPSSASVSIIPYCTGGSEVFDEGTRRDDPDQHRRRRWAARTALYKVHPGHTCRGG
jgi:hypothetical protein